MAGPAKGPPGPEAFPPKGAVIVALAVVGVMLFGLWDRLLVRAEQEQPIAFSHRLHAGEKKIPCQYCHAYARRSPVAGVPSVQTCMGCHQLIAVRQPEIRKVAAYWQQAEPIPWVKIHNLPDFVYFSHKRHIRAGLACQECHGPVETMEVVRMAEVFPREMGDCLKCHNQIAQTHEWNGRTFPAETQPSVDCATCHK